MSGDYYLFVLKRRKQSLLEPQIVAVQAQTLCVYYINNLVLIAAFVIFSSEDFIILLGVTLFLIRIILTFYYRYYYCYYSLYLGDVTRY